MHVLFALYTLASLTHFVHNAEFIALYPGLLGVVLAYTAAVRFRRGT
jgi:hypothetical protein